MPCTDGYNGAVEITSDILSPCTLKATASLGCTPYWLNVERENLTPPLIISGNCQNLPAQLLNKMDLHFYSSSIEYYYPIINRHYFIHWMPSFSWHLCHILTIRLEHLATDLRLKYLLSQERIHHLTISRQGALTFIYSLLANAFCNSLPNLYQSRSLGRLLVVFLWMLTYSHF